MIMPQRTNCGPSVHKFVILPSNFLSRRQIAAFTPASHPRNLPKTCPQAVADGVSAGKQLIGNPQKLPSKEDIVVQAFESVKAAWEAGIKRQRVELVLPLIGATDLDDWPGGIRQQFKAASPMVERLLRQLKTVPGLEGPLSAKILDDADAVGAWTGDNLALVLFPTAETLAEVRKITEARPNGLVLIVNPQWTTQGQVISDFGIFPWQKKSAMELIDTFSDGYAVQNLRINGDYVTWLYSYPNGWQVNVVQGPGESTCILQGTVRPSYKEVEAKLRSLPWSMSSKGLAERIVAEAEFNRRSVQGSPPKE